MIANSNQHPLEQHLFATGCLAHIICKSVTDNPILHLASYISGCLHDIGKVETQYQKWITNLNKANNTENGCHIEKNGPFSMENFPRHHETSTLIYQAIEDGKALPNRSVKDIISHAILWHHAKPITKVSFETFNDIVKKYESNYEASWPDTLEADANTIIDKVNGLAAKSNLIKFNSITNVSDLAYTTQDIKDKKLPVFKRYTEHQNIEGFRNEFSINASQNIVRCSIISADRIISALTAQELGELITSEDYQKLIPTCEGSTLENNIRACLSNFPISPRSEAQSAVARKLSHSTPTLEQSEIMVLQGAAGSGKTKTSLEWAMNKNAKQILWVCPTKQICESILMELSSEDYLPNNTIEILTGEKHQMITRQQARTLNESEAMTGDIVITTIDQIIGQVTTHKRISNLLKTLNAHVIFDEFHEYFNQPGLLHMFGEIIKSKSTEGKGNTLLISATPNYVALHSLLDINKYQVVKLSNFNKSTFTIIFEDFNNETPITEHPLSCARDTNTIVITNTVKTAQLAHLSDEHKDNLLYHAKYTQEHRAELFEILYKSFCKYGTQQIRTLRSSSILQSSLNISCKAVVSEISSAENIIQRLGRQNRFGEHPHSVFTIGIPSDFFLTPRSSDTKSFLKNTQLLSSSIAWARFLTKIVDKSLTLDEIYEHYELFCNHPENIAAIKEDLLLTLKLSIKTINNCDFDPKHFKHKKAKSDISKNSVRGSSVFVDAVVADAHNWKNITLRNEYISESMPTLNTTMSVENIHKQNEAGQSLLEHHLNNYKHTHGQKPDGYKSSIRTTAMSKARSKEHPILLSITPKHLSSTNSSQQHPEAIIYAIAKHQPLGFIPMKSFG